jgi:transposase
LVGIYRLGGETRSMLTMYQQITIKTLHEQGQTQAKIAKQFDCHRHTVANILQREKVIEKQTRVKTSACTPYKTNIREWLDKKISRLRIHELLGSEYLLKIDYTTLCKYIQKQFPKTPEAFGVQQVAPGEVAEIDFGYLGMLPGLDGKLTKTYGLAVVLGYSRLDYYAICYDQKLETLCRELENAFMYFGGVPKRLKVDNMKTAVLKNQHYDLTLNQDFLEFAYHFGSVVTPCEPYHPEQKGKVEGAVKYLQINFVSGRSFQDEADIKRQCKEWMDGYANQRIHGTTRRVPKEVFLSEEQEKLLSLPDEPFAFFNRGTRIVAPNCHIHFENNYYSVPAEFVRKEVLVRWNDNLLRIIYQGEQIALHHKSTGMGNYVTVRSHMPDHKVYSETEYQARHEARMKEIGESAHAYFEMLVKSKEGHWSPTVRAITGLCEEYGKEAVNASLKRALFYKATDVVIIKRILKEKLYLFALEQPLLQGMSKANADQDVGKGEIREKGIMTINDQAMSRDLSYYTISQ